MNGDGIAWPPEVNRTPVLCVLCPRRATVVSYRGAPFCAKHEAAVQRRGPDKTPLVIRFLLAAAMLAIVVALFGALAWGLLEARAGVR